MRTFMYDLVWKGKVLSTYGEIMRAIEGIDTTREASEFMAMYRAVDKHAEQNVGYLCGYLDPKEATKKLALFKAVHPIFGTDLVNITVSGALQAGVEAAHHQRSNEVMATIDPDCSE